MKLKKILSMLLIVVLVLASGVACSSNVENTSDDNISENEIEEADDENQNEDVLIGLVASEGGINDKSFNQSAYEGLERAQEEYGVNIKYIESRTREDYSENLEAFVVQDADLIIACGFQMADAIEEVAIKYPENYFMVVDAVVDLPNVRSVTFGDEEGSFLVGVIAGMMTESDKVGFIGGYDSEGINKFEVGFAAGVNEVNPDAGAKLIDRSNVSFSESFDDVNKGYEIAKSMYSNGVDVIYHAAAGVGLGMFTAAEEVTNQGKTAYGIGVDMDQAQTLPEYKEVILTSMVKRVDVATYTSIVDVLKSEFEGGMLTIGIDEGGVSIAETTEELVPDEIIQAVNDYESKIKNGEITVPSTRKELLEMTNE